MRTTKIFKTGHSLAVRIPKEFHVSDKEEVEISEKNGDIIIRAKPKNLSQAFELFCKFPEDFFSEGREDSLPQERSFDEDEY